MSDSNQQRMVVNARSTAFLPHDLEGPVQPEMSSLPISHGPRRSRAPISCAWSGVP